MAMAYCRSADGVFSRVTGAAGPKLNDFPNQAASAATRDARHYRASALDSTFLAGDVEPIMSAMVAQLVAAAEID